MADLEHVRLRISGRVQGVGYRYSAYHEATRLGLTGWVRNTMDGAVETEAQGPAAAVEAYVAWCRRGPALAHVTDVKITPRPGDKTLTDFRIRH